MASAWYRIASRRTWSGEDVGAYPSKWITWPREKWLSATVTERIVAGVASWQWVIWGPEISREASGITKTEAGARRAVEREVARILAEREPKAATP